MAGVGRLQIRIAKQLTYSPLTAAQAWIAGSSFAKVLAQMADFTVAPHCFQHLAITG